MNPITNGNNAEPQSRHPTSKGSKISVLRLSWGSHCKGESWEHRESRMLVLLRYPEGDREGDTRSSSNMQRGGGEATCPQDEFNCQNHNNNNN